VTCDIEKDLPAVLSQGTRLSRLGGGGEMTRFICGYMGCEPRLGRLVLAGLPPIFKVHIRGDASGRWLEQSIHFSVAAAGEGHMGGEAVVAKLSEALFAETLRRYVAQWPEGITGWLAGARDPDLGRALSLMHRRPSAPWTLADLSREAGISRSVFAERFNRVLGSPPMTYLTTWRLQLGARLIRTTGMSMAQVAGEVGYESEAAFNRAFKREFGATPARFRTDSRQPAVPRPEPNARP